MPYAKPQHGITQKFKAFIVTRTDFLILVHIGPVTQGIGQKGPVLKLVVNVFFQNRKSRWGVDMGKSFHQGLENRIPHSKIVLAPAQFNPLVKTTMKIGSAGCQKLPVPGKGFEIFLFWGVMVSVKNFNALETKFCQQLHKGFKSSGAIKFQ